MNKSSNNQIIKTKYTCSFLTGGITNPNMRHFKM